ncbi:MAG: beta-lactamase family protein [Bacteroidales bacterium]|nr:beta-lactamase family protein [Bacteroidales bacterium]
MKKHTIVIVSLFASLLLISCNFKTNDLEATHLSQERLARIDTMLNGYINAGKLSGATVLISRDNQIKYLKSFGYSNISDSIPLKNNYIHGIASMTKLVTCVAALTLYETGYFKMNDRLSDYLPEFKNMKVFVNNANGDTTKEAANPILIKDLFRHTSGLKYGSMEYETAGVDLGNVNSTSEFVQKIAAIPLHFEPGTTFEYGYSIDIIGCLIEKLSGKTLRDYLIENIFVPLKMDDTDFYVPKEKMDRLANFYMLRNDSLILAENYDKSAYKTLPKMYSGGGGLVSTAEDYAKFLQMLLNYGECHEKRILGRKTVELMQTDQLSDVANKGFLSKGQGHGLGSGLINNAGQYGELYSDGSLFWMGLRNTYFWIDYKENLFGIFMTQMSPFMVFPYGEQFRILTYQAIEDKNKLNANRESLIIFNNSQVAARFLLLLIVS